MENNIVNLIKELETKDGFELFEMVADNERLLKKLCDAVMRTYENIEHIKKVLG